MEATRIRLGSAIEWVLAAAIIVALVVVGAIVARELRPVSVAAPVVAQEPQPAMPPTPAGVPARAVFVPVLPLPGGKEVRVGDSVAAVAARLGREAEVGTQVVEPARFGERLTRFYEHAGSRFVLVFEPFEPDGEPRVAGIYLQ